MANRYWVGGTATWDATVGTKWSATSGGSGGASVPIASDDVFFDNLSTGTVTTSGTTVMNCRSLDFTGFTGTFSFANSTTIRIGDATAGAGNSALKIVSGMTYTNGGTSSLINFLSTSATQQTVTTAGKTLGAVTFSGTGSSYLLTDNLICTGANVTLSAGSLDTGNNNINAATLTLSGSTVRTMTLGSSVVTLTGGTGFVQTGSNHTFNAGTSSIVMTQSQGMSSTGNTFYDVTYQNFGTGTIGGANTFHNLSITGQNSNTVMIMFSANQVVNGTFTLAANVSSTNNRPFVGSNSFTAQRTITANAVSLTGVDLYGVIGAGSATWSGSRLGDAGFNTNITFDSPRTLYWVDPTGAGTKNWNDTNVWALSSGSSTKTADFPLVHDSIIIDANSGIPASRTIAISVPRACTNFNAGSANLAFTISTSPVTLTTSAPGNGQFYGSVTLKSGSTISGINPLMFGGAGNGTLISNGVSLINTTINKANNASLTIGDALSGGSNTLTLNAGILIGGGVFNITWQTFSLPSSATARVEFGSSAWISTGTSTQFGFSGTNYDFGTSTIEVSNVSTSAKTITPPSVNFYDLKISGQNVTLNGGMTVRNLMINTAGFATGLKIFSGQTVTVQNDVTTNGSVGSLAKLSATSAGTAGKISKSSGIVSVDYMSIQDSQALGGATFYAGANSTNVSGNSGWIFTAPPAVGANTGVGFLSMLMSM